MCFEALHGRGGLRICVHDEGARVTVPAHGPTLPVPAESGFGLGIGAAVADEQSEAEPVPNGGSARVLAPSLHNAL